MTIAVFDCFSAADFYLWMIEDKFLEIVSPFSAFHLKTSNSSIYWPDFFL